MADPAGRFSIALDDPTLEPAPTWTALDQTYPGLVASCTIDRGRQYELDRTDTGRALVTISDSEGLLDPTNPGSLDYPIKPLLQAAIGRWNPVTDEWFTRYRGFVEEMDTTVDPSQRVNRLELTLVDLFELVSSIEMLPGQFGNDGGAAGQVYFLGTDYTHADVDDGISGFKHRIEQVLGNCGIPEEFVAIFSGNINLHETTYSASESAMTAIYEAVDAEFPGVGNCYCDRFGRLVAHGRFAKFDPQGTADNAAPGLWDFNEWNVGDGAAVEASPDDTAHVRALAFNRGLSKIINRAIASPILPNATAADDAAMADQIVQGTASIGQYGIRSWSAQNLLTREGLVHTTPTDHWVETKSFASYYVDNYAQPENRITAISIRSLPPEAPGAAANWELLSKIDIGDKVNVTVASAGGGGFDAASFFVEGIHEEIRPLGVGYDDVTITLDLSPFEYFQHNPWADS